MRITYLLGLRSEPEVEVSDIRTDRRNELEWKREELREKR